MEGERFELIVEPTERWAPRAAREIERSLAQALEARGEATLVLAGGQTPRPVYRCLAAPSRRAGLDWGRVHFLWGDERCAPAEAAGSNFRLARETLLADLGVEAARIHPVPAWLPSPEAAAAYERRLRTLARGVPPRFDLVLLGIGRDGHTASLFPDPEFDPFEPRWVVPARAPRPPRERVTLSLSLINRARQVIFLVAGREKAEITARILLGAAEETLPAARVQPADGRLCWLLDRPAAAGLRRRTG